DGHAPWLFDMGPLRNGARREGDARGCAALPCNHLDRQEYQWMGMLWRRALAVHTVSSGVPRTSGRQG
ncbi:MAG TPA: hypothetical protein VF916_04370, partial [Ktedonobacterales bacterium]